MSRHEPGDGERMSRAEYVREKFGGGDAAPCGPTPPASLTDDVDLRAAEVYLEAAQEAGQREHACRADGDYEGALMYATLAQRHLRAYAAHHPEVDE